jgi:hypothetical protein
VLFHDYAEPDDFNACLGMLRRSKAALLIITERTNLTQNAAQAGILLAPSWLVHGWSLLHAIRMSVGTASQPAPVDSTPELPFTE